MVAETQKIRGTCWIYSLKISSYASLVKFYELAFALLPHSQYSPHLVPVTFYSYRKVADFAQCQLC